MRLEPRRRGRRQVVPRLLVVLAMLATFLVVSSYVMLLDVGVRARWDPLYGEKRAIWDCSSSNGSLQCSPEVLAFAGKLLLFMEAFVDKEISEVSEMATGWKAKETLGLPVNATPAVLLSEYYEKQLPRLNNKLEKRLDNSSIKNVTHSSTYWSPTHVVRRGYGLEGSIFVGLIHNGEASSVRVPGSTSLDSTCAMTVQNLYQSALWPVAIFTGIVEMVYDPTFVTGARSRTDGVPPRRVSPPPSSCIPAAYQSRTCAETYGFCPRDNIRLRQLRASPKSPSGREGDRLSSDDEGEKYRCTSYVGDAECRSEHFTSIAAQRYAALTLYRGETYVMFLNAGVLFVPSWDVRTRLLLLQLPSRQPILSQMANPIERRVVRRVWEDVVVSRVRIWSRTYELVELDTEQSPYSEGNSVPYTTERSNFLQEEEGYSLYDARAVQLHDADNSSCTIAEGGSTHAVCTANESGEEGLSSGTIVEFLFRLSMVGVRSMGSQDVNDTSRGKQGNSAGNELPIPSVRGRRPNNVQLYWMNKFHVPLREELLKSVNAQDVTSHVCAVAVRMACSALGGKNVGDTSSGGSNCGSTQNESSAYIMLEADEPQFKLKSVLVQRLTEVLDDQRYMEPSSIHWCDNGNDAACQDTQRQETTRLSLPQPLLSTDFLFTYAHAFFNFSRNTANGSAASTHVPLDPYLGLLTADEEAVLLAARLWTHGWDFYAPTEPLAFAAASEEPETGNRTDSTHRRTSNISAKRRAMRRRGLVRMNFVLFGLSNGTRTPGSDEEVALRDVAKYGLGSHRSRESFLQFIRLNSTPGGKAQCSDEEKEKCDGDVGNGRTRRWCYHGKACGGP